MIRDFRHKGLEAFFKTGSRAGIQPTHASKLKMRLATLNAASNPLDMNLPGWGLHQLKGDLAGQWSVSVSGNWRVVFAFEGSDAVLVDYLDYH